MIAETWQHDILLTLPISVLSIGALLILMLEVFLPPNWPRSGVTFLVLLAGLMAMYLNLNAYHPDQIVFQGLVYADGQAAFFSALILIGTMLALLFGASQLTVEGVHDRSEYYALLLMTTVGAIVFATAAEMITLFLGLETMSLALYCLCGSATRMKRSAESALKYFILGSFSSAFLLYGMALLYGLTGSTSLAALSQISVTANQGIFFFSLGLILVGLIFKLGAVPFHFWTPDVYQGAPTPVTAYMACVIKAAAVAATLRVLWGGFGNFIQFWSGAIWFVAALTMVFANLVALRQRSLKRLLAYSSIGHAGYMLMAFLAPLQFGGGPAILYYLIAYTIMTMGAFGVVMAVTSKFTGSPNADDISRFNGLGQTQPFLGLAMSIFLLSLAGLPPGMAGLLGKFYVFNAAIKADYVGLAIIGVLCSAVSVYYYLRIIVVMYFLEPDEEASGQASEVTPSLLSATLSVCVVCVVLFGLFPSLIFNPVSRALSF